MGAEAGYADFREQSHLLVGQPIKRMSKLTERLMQSIDYGWVAKRRRANYNHLLESLKDSNLLQISLDNDTVPMVYPYLMTRERLRDNLIRNKIFVACYWPNVSEWADENSLEKRLVQQMVPIPVDQRYDILELEYIIRTINH